MADVRYGRTPDRYLDEIAIAGLVDGAYLLQLPTGLEITSEQLEASLPSVELRQ